MFQEAEAKKIEEMPIKEEAIKKTTETSLKLHLIKPEDKWIEGLEPEKRDVGQKVLEAFEAFADTYGKAGVEQLTRVLNEKGTIQAEDIQGVQEKIGPRAELQPRPPEDKNETSQRSGYGSQRGSTQSKRINN